MVMRKVVVTTRSQLYPVMFLSQNEIIRIAEDPESLAVGVYRSFPSLSNSIESKIESLAIELENSVSLTVSWQNRYTRYLPKVRKLS